MNTGSGRSDETGPGNPAPYRFTPEELRVLKECNQDSFYQRCLPFGAILGCSTYYGVKSGYLRASPRFGAIPKVSVAVIVGYFLGKFSYQQRCAEKLMALPNSQIGEMLRRRKTKGVQESLDSGFGPGMSLPPFSGISSSDTYSDVDTSFDAGQSRYEGLDDSHRPSIDNPVLQDDEMPPEQQHIVTYEELRKKNREEYQEKRKGGFLGSNKPKTTETQKPPEESATIHRNKYGDTME